MRLPQQGQIAGVCAGLAQYFDLDVTLIRVLFVVLAFATGGGMVLVYIILAIVMPTDEMTTGDGQTAISQNVAHLKTEFAESDRSQRIRNMLGLGLVALGIWLLAVQFFPTWVDFRWDYVWPIILVLIGIGIISRNRR